LLVLLWASLRCHAPAQAAQAAQAADAAFSLRWEIASHQYREADASGTTVAILRLQNRGSSLARSRLVAVLQLPFELHLGALPGHLVAEHLGGTLLAFGRNRNSVDCRRARRWISRSSIRKWL
jgi:hypothetical protein